MAKEIPTIVVSEGVLKLWMDEARATCKSFEVEPTKLQQDLNAIATVNTLVKLGVPVPKDKLAQVFQLMKLGGNASQNRQRFETKTQKAADVDVSVYEALLRK